MPADEPPIRRARPELAELYLAAGYALFLPHRRGHGLSAGEYPIDALRGSPRLGDALIELHERYLDDTLQAVAWLEDEPWVEDVAISGVSHGAIQSILAATRPCVAFAPAAMAWATVPELHVEVWSGSHPFFTGKQTFVDSAGRVEKFQRKFQGNYFTGKEKKKA